MPFVTILVKIIIYHLTLLITPVSYTCNKIADQVKAELPTLSFNNSKISTNTQTLLLSAKEVLVAYTRHSENLTVNIMQSKYINNHSIVNTRQDKPSVKSRF